MTAVDMSARRDGRIRTEECAFHMEVVWDFDYTQKSSRSPVFVDGHQKYALGLSEGHASDFSEWYMSGMSEWHVSGLSESHIGTFPRFSIHLYKVGPACRSPERWVRWWAGLKRPDGAYYHRIMSGYLKDREELLNSFGVEEVKAQRLASEGRLTFFLRLSARQDSPAAQACVHGVTGVCAWGDGSILEKACPLHTEVQWNLLHESSSTYWCFVSPEFVIDHQLYRLELISVSYKHVDLNLYRLGPSEKKTETSSVHVKWWAGMKRHDGSSYHRNVGGLLDMSVECQLMRKVATLKRFARKEVQYLCRNLSVFFLLSRGRTSTAPDVCTHGE